MAARTALSCTCSCLTGAFAFAAKSPAAVLASILVDKAPRLSQRMSDVPPEVDELCARMLSKDPAQCPASVRVVSDAIERIMENVGCAPYARRTIRPKLRLVVGEGADACATTSASNLVARPASSSCK